MSHSFFQATQLASSTINLAIERMNTLIDCYTNIEDKVKH